MHQGHTQVYKRFKPCTTTTTSTDTSEQGKQNEKTEWSYERTLMHPMKPDNTTIPDSNITKPANHSTEEGGTQRRERLLVFLPLGGGKLRCRDVLGLGSGRGSCLNPEGWGKSGVGERWSKGRWLDKPFCRVAACKGKMSRTGLWCWFQECVVSCTSIRSFMALVQELTKTNLHEWSNSGHRSAQMRSDVLIP